MSETKSLSAPKASFDRRAVVKSAAWSVPVIAAAIAAPAAAASGGTPPVVKVSASFVGNPVAITVAGQHVTSGTGPQGFTISTNGAAISGPASVPVPTAPADKATADSKDRLSVGTINGSSVTAGQWSGAVYVPAPGASGPVLTLGSYSRTGNGQLANGVTLTYVVTLTIAVFDSVTKKTTTLDPIQTAVRVFRKA